MKNLIETWNLNLNDLAKKISEVKSKKDEDIKEKVESIVKEEIDKSKKSNENTSLQ